MGGSSSKSPASAVQENIRTDDLLEKIYSEASKSSQLGRTGNSNIVPLLTKRLIILFNNVRDVDEKYGMKSMYHIYMKKTDKTYLDLNETYRQLALKKIFLRTNPKYARDMNDVFEKHYESIKELNQNYSPKTKVKRSIDTEHNDLAEQVTDESNNDRIDTDLDDHPMNNDPTSSDIPNNVTFFPITAIIASSTITTALAASHVKSMHHERQGGSTMGTTIRSGLQVAIPTVVGGTSVGVALATGFAAWPITLAIAGAAVFVGTVCAGTTLMVTLYYNKFFVAKKLRSIEESVKKMPQDECFLAQKKALIGLIHHSLAFLNDDKEQGIEKSNTKIKKLDSKILFNLIEMQHILSSSAFAKSMEESKEVQKLSKNMNKDIDELLEHSVLFSLLINDVKHIKEIYERLNIIKVCEQANTNQPIQNSLAQINRDYLNNKIANYADLLERFKKEQEYTASKKGKLRVASKAVISCIPEKKEFVQLHEEVISLASEINDDYHKVKRVIPHLQEHSNAFKVDTSKQQLFDIYTAYKALSYRDTIGESIASLTPSKEPECKVNDDYIPNANEFSVFRRQ